MFSHFCGLLGHDLRHCATHFALTKNGGEVVCQYGGLVERDRRSAKGVIRDQAQEKHNDQPTMQTVVENYSENCGVDDRRDDGKNVLSGTIPDLQLHIPENHVGKGVW